MQGNRAYCIREYGGPEVLRLDELPVPVPGSGEILVHVQAVGINALDWKIRQGLVKEGFPLTEPMVLGVELSGIVISTGANANKFLVDDRVMGPIGLGAYTDYAVVREGPLCLIPADLTDVRAAAISVSALTAWQMVRAAGAIRPGQKVLIHGAAGGVGGFAVQFAKAAGARVFATASEANIPYLLNLGADVVIDYHTERFEDRVSGIDLILDLVGGETLDRSWGILTSGGTIVSITTPDIAKHAPTGELGLWLSMKPDADRLGSIACQVASGELLCEIAEVVGFAGLPAAIERTRTGHAAGKIVVDFTR